MSVFIAMLAAAIGLAVGIVVVPYVSFPIAGLVVYPIRFVVAKIAPWDEDEDFHPRDELFMKIVWGLACAICVSGALVYTSRVWPSHLRPTWPIAVVPGSVAFIAAFLTPLVGPFPLIAAALFGIPAAGVAAHVWG